jgi:hypothetical protein
MKTFTAGERYRAIVRGMDFICGIASRRSLRIHGHDLITCFPLIAFTSLDPTLRRMARECGRNLVLRRQAVCRELPARARPNVLMKSVIVGCAEESFGLPNEGLKQRIRQRARRYSAQDLLGFEPAKEPPPDDQPEDCACGRENPRGRKTCRKCRRRLTIMSRYRMWMRALSITFWGERYGVVLGAKYPEVLQWLPEMRPYPGRRKQTHSHFSDTVYAVTHVVYTLNGYGRYNLSPRWLPHEFAFLKENIKEALHLEDPDMVGEFLDSLKSFGLSQAHPIIRLGTNYLISAQNPDGSWGDPDSEDILSRYHATWAAIDGLRDYAWRGEKLSYPKLQPLLEHWARSK